MTTRLIEMPYGSIEYLNVPVTADVSLAAQPVAIAVVTSGYPGALDWVAAAWTGPTGTTRTARVLLDGTLGPGRHDVYARLTDTSETVIVHAGTVWIR